MPLLRIEIQATDRAEAQRLLALYAKGGRHPSLDAQVIDAVWARGRTPVGQPRLVGLTNGRSALYKFDVDVDTEVRGL